MNSHKEYSLFDILNLIGQKKIVLSMIFVGTLIFSSTYFFFVQKKTYQADTLLSISINDSIQTTLGNSSHLIDKVQELTPLLYNQIVFNKIYKDYSENHEKISDIGKVLSHELFRDNETTGKGVLLSMKLNDTNTHLILEAYLNELETKLNLVYLKNVLDFLDFRHTLEVDKLSNKKHIFGRKLNNMKKQKDSLKSGVELTNFPKRGQVLMTFSDIVNPNYVELESEIIELENKILLIDEKSSLLKSQITIIDGLRDRFINVENLKDTIPEQYRFFSNSSSVLQTSDQPRLIGYSPLNKAFISSFVVLFFAMIFFTLRHIYFEK